MRRKKKEGGAKKFYLALHNVYIKDIIRKHIFCTIRYDLDMSSKCEMMKSPQFGWMIVVLISLLAAGAFVMLGYI